MLARRKTFVDVRRWMMIPLLLAASVALPAVNAAEDEDAALSKYPPAQREKMAQAAKLEEQVLELYHQGKYSEAVPIAEQVEKIIRDELGEESPEYVDVLSGMAGLDLLQSKFARAEDRYLHVLAIRQKTEGTETAGYAQTLNSLGNVSVRRGDFAKAESYLRAAIELRIKVLDPDDSDIGVSLNNLAECFRIQSDFANAEPLYRKALEVYEKSVGKQSEEYSGAINNLGLLYHEQGDPAQAEALFQESLEIRKALFGEQHPDYAGSLNNLAMLYHEQGDNERAITLMRQASEIFKANPGEISAEYATQLNNLGRAYDDEGEYEKAIASYQESLRIFQAVYADQHPDIAMCMMNLGLVYHNQGNYAQAEPLFLKAREIYRQTLGERDPAYATCIGNLALNYNEMGQYAKAEPIHREALKTCQATYGPHHICVALYQNNLAYCLIVQKRFSEAAPLAQQAAASALRLQELAATTQSERRQLVMAEASRFYLNNALSAARDAPDFHSQVYSQVLAWKGAITLRQSCAHKLRQEAKNDPALAKLFDQLETSVRQLATLATTVADDDERAAQEARIQSLGLEVELLQGKLAHANAGYALQLRRAQQSASDIGAALPDQTALVDLIEYAHYGYANKDAQHPSSEKRFAAFVLRRGHSVKWIDLGAAEQINAAIETWRKSYGNGDAGRQASEAIRKIVWQPLEESLRGASIVLISPDGELAKLPWGALPGSQPGTYLIEELATAIVPVPQTIPSLIAEDANRDAGPPSLLVVGNVNYGGEPGPLLASNEVRRAARGTKDPWSPLTNTRAEILAVRDSFEQRFPEGRSRPLRDADASEGKVRELAPKFRYLHFATHGFFADPDEAQDDADTGRSPVDQFGELRKSSVAQNHPGLLSGIVLAGANHPPEADKDDGILTALEVAELDLQNVEMVTLSACETGLGKTAGGEGVLGLQRAFHAAGVKTTVSSLWKVPDDATRSLMIEFYEKLWSGGETKLSRIEALRQAQLSLMREGVKRGLEIGDQPADAVKRLPPFYWGAFVLSGQWR